MLKLHDFKLWTKYIFTNVVDSCIISEDFLNSGMVATSVTDPVSFITDATKL